MPESVYYKKKTLRQHNCRSVQKLLPKLADFGAQEPAVIFDSDLTAAEQVGHSSDGFAAAFGAGADGEN